ncbi:MAG: sigma-70 family RNA polymerase sigma factor [Candidatus Eisenbacteria bacterium]
MDHDPGDSALPASTPPEALVEQYRSFVTALAKKILKSLPSFVELEDLEAYGTIGLIESSRRFDPSRGVQFKTFAYYRIRGAIYDGIRKMAWFEKEPNADVVYEAASNEVLSDSPSAQRSDRGQSTLDDDIAQTRTILRLAGATPLPRSREHRGGRRSESEPRGGGGAAASRRTPPGVDRTAGRKGAVGRGGLLFPPQDPRGGRGEAGPVQILDLPGSMRGPSRTWPRSVRTSWIESPP